MLKVIVSLTIEGIHKWSGCNIKEVDFLKQEHRHIFYIKCKKVVSHDDREIEIIMLKRTILAYLRQKYEENGICKFGDKSCEMIAKELLEVFSLSSCEVLEDNENGAEVSV